MDFLKLILGENLFNEVNDKIIAYNNDPENKDKQLNIANLGTGDYVAKRKYHDLETKYNSKLTELEQANNLINDFKANTSTQEEFKNKISEYESTIKDLQTQLHKNTVENALKLALLNAHVTDIDYLSYKLKEQGEIELNDKGEIKNVTDKIKDLKVKYPNFFESSIEKHIDVNKLPSSDSEIKLSKEYILKKPYVERVELYNKDPEAFNKIMNE